MQKKDTQEQPILVDRKVVTLIRKGEPVPPEKAGLTGAAALAFVWELTKEVFSLSGSYDVESRLQRHVVTFTRKQR
jgi:hypothetical protein